MRPTTDIKQTISSAALLSFLWVRGTPHAPLGPPGTRQLLWARGVILTVILLMIYTSMRYLTLSEFWMTTSGSPFPTALLCWWFLGERFTKLQGVCCGESSCLPAIGRMSSEEWS